MMYEINIVKPFNTKIEPEDGSGFVSCKSDSFSFTIRLLEIKTIRVELV